MIFSLSDALSARVDFESEQTDIFCFFSTDKNVLIPSSLWLHAVCASLKMKKNVLILESAIENDSQVLKAQRWHAGENFLWLAPRALSVLLEAPFEISGSYKTLKIHLSQFK